MQAIEPSPPRRAWQIDRELRLAARPARSPGASQRLVHQRDGFPHRRRSHPALLGCTRARFRRAGDSLCGDGGVDGQPGLRRDAKPRRCCPEGIRLAAREAHDEPACAHGGIAGAPAQARRAFAITPTGATTIPARRGGQCARRCQTLTLTPDRRGLEKLEEKTLAGWLCQLAGGAFGTAIEGYHTDRIAEVYGVIDGYITTPETMNDDVVYELVFLDVFERHGRKLTRTPAWAGVGAPDPLWLVGRVDRAAQPEHGHHAAELRVRSATPTADWIGAQMRGMVCGMLAPGWPLEAARLAYVDGTVSHARNGIYGEMYAAVLTALAYVRMTTRAPAGGSTGLRAAGQRVRGGRPRNPRRCCAASRIRPRPGEFSTRVRGVQLDSRLSQPGGRYAGALARGGDLTTAFRWLAHAGLDVDCNAGLVGTVLGVMHGAPDKWAAPLGDLLETYLRGKERLSIRELAARRCGWRSGERLQMAEICLRRGHCVGLPLNCCDAQCARVQPRTRACR